jgi:outer membrane protein
MTRSSLRSNARLQLSFAVAIAGLSTGCVSSAPEPSFDPKLLGDRYRQAATTITPATPLPRTETLDSPYLTTDPAKTPDKQPADPLLAPLEQSGNAVKLEIRDAIQRAVVNNLDIKVASFQPAIDEARVTEAETRFDPIVFASLELSRTDAPAGLSRASFGGPGQISDSLNATGRAGLRQALTSGGQVEISAQTQRAEDFGDSGSINYETTLQVQLTQPLLRDFGQDVNKARIVINRNNQVVSTLEFRRQVEESVADIERLYWQLAQAERDLQIQQELLQRTLDYALILWQRREQDASRVSISQANARVESRRATLVRARARVGDLSDQLKRLINDPNMPVGSSVQLSADSTAVVEQIIYDAKEQVDTALQYRLELEQQRLRIDNAAVTARVAKNNLLPQLDLVLRGGVNGVDGDILGATWDASNFGIDDRFNYTGSVGLQLEVPIGNRGARAIETRTRLALMQSLNSYEATQTQVVQEVSQALREVDTTWQEMVRTRQSALAARDALEAIEVRERAGEPLTPNFVDLKLNLLEALAIAASSEASAIANYNIALSTLERVKGTLLSYNSIVLQEDTKISPTK